MTVEYLSFREMEYDARTICPACDHFIRSLWLACQPFCRFWIPVGGVVIFVRLVVLTPQSRLSGTVPISQLVWELS